MVKLNSSRTALDEKPVTRRAVLIANFAERTAELRLNPAESRHAHADISGRMTAEAYYNAYLQKADDVLGAKTEFLDLREVVKSLVKKEDPRIVRIQIDDHTNQKNYKTKTTVTESWTYVTVQTGSWHTTKAAKPGHGMHNHFIG